MTEIDVQLAVSTVEEQALALWREWFEYDGNPSCVDDDAIVNCFFCGRLFFINSKEHGPDCVFIRAKELIAKANLP